jgi:hypothetical protein
MCSKIIIAREREENVTWRQSPITQEKYSALLDLAKESDINSLELVVVDWFTLIRITGLRCSEYAQKSQSEVDEYKYPSGKCVVEAFIWNNWRFYNSKDCTIKTILIRSNRKISQGSSKSLFGPEK